MAYQFTEDMTIAEYFEANDNGHGGTVPLALEDFGGQCMWVLKDEYDGTYLVADDSFRGEDDEGSRNALEAVNEWLDSWNESRKSCGQELYERAEALPYQF